MGRFSNAIGLWDFEINGQKFELKPTMNDIKNLRNILIDDNIRKNKITLFNKFSEFMFNLFRQAYPEEDETETREYIEMNINTLFEEAMIGFRWTTRDSLEKTKTEGFDEIKKLMSSS